MRLSNLKSYLPDIYDKTSGSNISKIFKLFTDEVNIINELVDKISTWRSIDSAQGKVLDQLGANVGQARGKTTDDIFRVLIRGKVARNYSDGSFDKIINALSVSLKCPLEEIYILSANETIHEKEMAALIVRKLPIEYLNRSGLSVSQFIQILKTIVPAGVSISYVTLEGTFSFAQMPDEIEMSAEGFGDIAGTTGGTLGDVFKATDDYKLPI